MFSITRETVWTLDKGCQIKNDLKWAASWQNQQNNYVPSKDSDQPGLPSSLNTVFAVRMKKAWDRSYPFSAQQRLWSDWADVQADLSLRWAALLVLSWGDSNSIYILDNFLSKIIWAASSEFVSSSIPSWQILTAHAQPIRGSRDLAFCLTFLLTHCFYERAAKVLARLRGCAGSPEPSLLA